MMELRVFLYFEILTLLFGGGKMITYILLQVMENNGVNS